MREKVAMKSVRQNPAVVDHTCCGWRQNRERTWNCQYTNTDHWVYGSFGWVHSLNKARYGEHQWWLGSAKIVWRGVEGVAGFSQLPAATSQNWRSDPLHSKR